MHIRSDGEIGKLNENDRTERILTNKFLLTLGKIQSLFTVILSLFSVTAKWIVDYFKPQGSILEPAAGENAFYNLFDNEEKYRCEITDGLDFFEWDKKVDWIITNPPYSIYDLFLQKAFSVADNVVFFVPIAKAFKSNKIQQMVINYGGLKEIVYMGGGSKHGFAFGFPVGCLHYQKGFVGDCKITYVMDGW